MFWGQTSWRILHHPSRPVITSTFREAKLELGHHLTFKGTNFPAFPYFSFQVNVALNP